MEIFYHITTALCRGNSLRKLLCQWPHADIAATGNRRRQTPDIGEKPPVQIALIPKRALLLPLRLVRHLRNRLVVASRHNLPAPLPHLIPIPDIVDAPPHAECFIRPRDKPCIFPAGESLRDRYRTPPLPLNRHPAPVLHELNARENHHGIRPRASKSMCDHCKQIARKIPSAFTIAPYIPSFILTSNYPFCQSQTTLILSNQKIR